jgi:hypothetical protein
MENKIGRLKIVALVVLLVVFNITHIPLYETIHTRDMKICAMSNQSVDSLHYNTSLNDIVNNV